ncbi:MAG TPA: twin-arginine translocation signal domain-containing protein [Bryobacteraceae bacterium]|jgi:hypothetical protein|nr:twin-arginine translocation signal domain-containing protein [Bryobacteraceae bacterium]
MNSNDHKTDRRRFLQTAAAAGALGASAVTAALGQSGQSAPIEGLTRDQLRRDMMAGIEDDVKKDLELRTKAVEELPKPAGLRPGGMLDARFPVSYKSAVPEAMRLLTDYFAAYNDRDLKAVAQTLHFPYATYETAEATVYRTPDDFIRNPPPSIHESTAADSQLRPGTYDIMDVLQLQTYNPVNVGLELCYTRYRGDGYKLGINQGIYAVTNNDGKWGIQLSSVIFTPTEYIGDKFDDAIEAHIRQGRTSMAEFGDHDYDMLTRGRGGPNGQAGAGRGGRGGGQAGAAKTASITGAPGATSFFLSGWADKPMEPYNSKGRKSRLSVAGVPDAAAINAMSAGDYPIAVADRGIGPTNIVTASGKPGWFYEMSGGGVGHYGYTKTLDDSRVLHAGPEKAHAIGGYIRYTPDHVFISETRSLSVMIFDKRQGRWGGGGGFGQSIRRDRTNDPLA